MSINMATDTLLLSARVREIELRFSPVTPSLMERAGLAAADLAARLISESTHADGPVLIMAGPGNNGGDAYVCARHLRARGHAVTLISAAPEATLPADAAAARRAWLASGGDIRNDFPSDEPAPVLAIDGLFGIGLTRPIAGRYAAWVRQFNALDCPRLALDIPSGLDADTGSLIRDPDEPAVTLNPQPAVIATHTLTFIANKPGLHTLDGPDHAGEVICDALDLPANAFDGEGPQSGHLLQRPQHIANALAPRRSNSHKGSYGSVAIIGGAPGMSGAALLAGRAALHLGAGRTYVGVLNPLAFDPLQPELMLRPPAEAMAAASVIGIGPGLSQSPEALALLRYAIAQNLPLALDADALNLLAAHPVLFKRLARRSAPTILTPHPTEAARLAGCTTAEIQRNRIQAASQLAAQTHAVVVLKGNGTVIANPHSQWWINASGNPGLATGGTGDVLLGFVSALLAQSLTADQAACAAVYLHGAAADACVAAGQGPIGLTAGELIPAARACWNNWMTQYA